MRALTWLLKFEAAGGGAAELRITNAGDFAFRTWNGAVVALTRAEVQDWCDSFSEALDEQEMLLND
jgi:hypothetical protein